MARSAGRSVRSRLIDLATRATTSPYVALVPLRLFLGGTFLYAGLDKILSPGFFLAAAPGSIQQQLAAFARHSPLGGLIVAIQPLAVEVGFAIALLEIAVGLGALTGYGFRLAATGGAGLALLFWLTASWGTKPYYYGPDLPYALGWITVALAGHGDVLVARRFRVPVGVVPTGAGSVTRRAVLQAAVLGTGAVIVAMVAVPLRRLGLGSDAGISLGDETGTSSGASSGGPTGGPTSTATKVPAGAAVATVAAVQRTGSAPFTIPFDAPAPLPAGDPGVIVQLRDGTYAAFDAICTHAGCTVEWDEPDALLVCPCHGAVFDPAKGGVPIAGPTDLPLTTLPLVLDQATGTFRLRGA